MHDNESPITMVPKRVPWNKGKLIGPRRHYGKNTSGPYEPGSKSSNRCAIWRCSIWPSTASYGVVTLSPSGWQMSPPTGMQPSERPCARERPADRYDSS